MLLFGYLNSTYQTGIKSPLDEAIVRHSTLDIGGYSKIGEIPFDFERRCLSTSGNPLRSRPSLPLTITTLLIVAVGFVLPYTLLAGPPGFTPLPALYFLFLAVMIVSYLLLVELVKRRLMRRYA